MRDLDICTGSPWAALVAALFLLLCQALRKDPIRKAPNLLSRQPSGGAFSEVLALGATHPVLLSFHTNAGPSLPHYELSHQSLYAVY